MAKSNVNHEMERVTAGAAISAETVVQMEQVFDWLKNVLQAANRLPKLLHGILRRDHGNV